MFNFKEIANGTMQTSEMNIDKTSKDNLLKVDNKLKRAKEIANWFTYEEKLDEEIEKLEHRWKQLLKDDRKRRNQKHNLFIGYEDEPKPKSDNYLKLVKQFKKFEDTWDKIPPKLPLQSENIKGSFFPLSNNIYDIKEDIRDFIIREESIRGQYMRETEAYEKPAYEVGIEEFYNLSKKGDSK